jgi:hypothetical protein
MYIEPRNLHESPQSPVGVCALTYTPTMSSFRIRPIKLKPRRPRPSDDIQETSSLKRKAEKVVRSYLFQYFYDYIILIFCSFAGIIEHE